MDADEDPGGMVHPIFFYCLLPRFAHEDEEPDNAAALEFVPGQAE